MIFKFKVQEKTTLKNFLKKQHFSKRLLPKIKYCVTVNGKHVLLEDWIEQEDLIEIDVPEKKQDFTALKGKIEIVYEDQYLIVLNKPAFINTIPSISEIGLINYLKSYLVNDSIHVINRLDKNTTGLVLIAKNPYIHALFENMIIEKKLFKKYFAIANKTISHGVITFKIKKEKNSMKRVVDDTGQSACSEYRLIQDLGNTALYEVILHTGRTHQIRVHFSSMGANLLGDELYLGDLTFFKRHALHCGYLEFNHPILHKKMKIECDLPQDFKEYIKNSQ